MIIQDCWWWLHSPYPSFRLPSSKVRHSLNWLEENSSIYHIHIPGSRKERNKRAYLGQAPFRETS